MKEEAHWGLSSFTTRCVIVCREGASTFCSFSGTPLLASPLSDTNINGFTKTTKPSSSSSTCFCSFPSSFPALPSTSSLRSNLETKLEVDKLEEDKLEEEVKIEEEEEEED